jgi:hypothetical protein
VTQRGYCNLPCRSESTAKGATKRMLLGDVEGPVISGIVHDGRPTGWFPMADFGVSGVQSSVFAVVVLVSYGYLVFCHS